MHRLLPLLLAALLALAACGNDPALEVPDDADTGAVGGDAVSDQPADAQPTFVSPSDGDVVTSPVTVEMSATGVAIVPASDPVVGEGHFHVTVDQGCQPDGEVIPGPGEAAEADGYFHFGTGASEGELSLTPGTYELCLQIADGPHRVFGGSDTITITVE